MLIGIKGCEIDMLCIEQLRCCVSETEISIMLCLKNKSVLFIVNYLPVSPGEPIIHSCLNVVLFVYTTMQIWKAMTCKIFPLLPRFLFLSHFLIPPNGLCIHPDPSSCSNTPSYGRS